MLQKLDAEHLNRLALAEALANMSTDDFDMRNTSRCICGHTLRMFGDRRLPPPPQYRVIMGRGLMPGRLKAAADQQGLLSP